MLRNTSADTEICFPYKGPWFSLCLQICNYVPCMCDKQLIDGGETLVCKKIFAFHALVVLNILHCRLVRSSAQRSKYTSFCFLGGYIKKGSHRRLNPKSTDVNRDVVFCSFCRKFNPATQIAVAILKFFRIHIVILIIERLHK